MMDSFLHFHVNHGRICLHQCCISLSFLFAHIVMSIVGPSLFFLTQFLYQAIPMYRREPRRDPSNCRLYEHRICIQLMYGTVPGFELAT